MKRKKVKNIIFYLLLLYSILFMTFSYKSIKAKAGDVNTTEEELLTFLSQVFEWEGKKYIIKSEYIGKARNYLNKDEVDIKDSEKEGLFSLFYENIAVGIQEGYLIENVSEEGSGENQNPEDTEDGKSEDPSQEEKKDNVSSETSQEDIKANASSETSQDDKKANASSETSQDDKKANASNETSQEDKKANVSSETSQEDIKSNASSETSQEDIKDNISSEGSTGESKDNIIGETSLDSPDKSKESDENSQKVDLGNYGDGTQELELEEKSIDNSLNHNSDKVVANQTSHSDEQIQHIRYSTTRITEEIKLVIFIVIVAVFISIIAYVKYRFNE